MVQAVMLFGSETWVVTPCMRKALGWFQTQVERQMTRRLMRRKPDGKWSYTSVEMAREEAGLLKMEDYIRRRQNTVSHYIATQSLLDLCEGLEVVQGARVGMRW